MRKLTAAFFLLLLPAAGIVAQEHTNAIPVQTQKPWITYTSPEGRYSVSLPVQPKLSTQETTTGTGDTLTQYLVAASGDSVYVMIGYFDYESGMKLSLNDARDGMLEGVKATLLSDEAFSLGGWPGKQIKIEGKTDTGVSFVSRARLYDVSRRVYILQCLSEKASDGPAVTAQCRQFLDSFKAQSRP